jgi:hypothetical protein
MDHSEELGRHLDVEDEISRCDLLDGYLCPKRCVGKSINFAEIVTYRVSKCVAATRCT